MIPALESRCEFEGVKRSCVVIRENLPNLVVFDSSPVASNVAEHGALADGSHGVWMGKDRQRGQSLLYAAPFRFRQRFA